MTERKLDMSPLNTVPIGQIHIQDRFWDRYIHLVKDVLIPYQWDILNDRIEGVETRDRKSVV